MPNTDLHFYLAPSYIRENNSKKRAHSLYFFRYLRFMECFNWFVFNSGQFYRLMIKTVSRQLRGDKHKTQI